MGDRPLYLPLILGTARQGRQSEHVANFVLGEMKKRLEIETPEYNHGYPGLLKHALDMCLEEYIHKVVGLVGVSAGPFGGSRVIEQMVQVVRELGLAVTFTDLNFSKVRDAFDGKR